jgi:hypothetical protein
MIDHKINVIDVNNETHVVYLGLLVDGLALSNKFKTQKTYGFQPLCLGANSSRLLAIYWNTVRPWAAASATQPMDPQPTDPLFIIAGGTPCTDLGRRIQV